MAKTNIWRKMFMKKFIIVLVVIMLLPSVTYATTSEDTSLYVRQDVYNSDMRNINDKLNSILEELKVQREELKAQGEAINKLNNSIATLSERTDGNYKNLDTRINDLRQDIYLGLVILGLLAGFPAAKEFLKWREETKEARKPSFTLEDVEKLIETKFNSMSTQL